MVKAAGVRAAVIDDISGEGSVILVGACCAIVAVGGGLGIIGGIGKEGSAEDDSGSGTGIGSENGVSASIAVGSV